MPSVRKIQAIRVHGLHEPRPGRIDPAGDQRGGREGERHGEADIAEVEQRRVDRETHVLQQGIEILPLDRGRQRCA